MPQQYPISPPNSNGSSSDDDPSDEEERKPKRHLVPNWATSLSVMQQAMEQESMDADEIFGQPVGSALLTPSFF